MGNRCRQGWTLNHFNPHWLRTAARGLCWTNRSLKFPLPRTGARLLAPGTRTVIDIGGGTVKVIQLDDDGNLSDFLMNGKCAAGTGRFWKSSQCTLGASVSSARCDYHWRPNHMPSPACTVFGRVRGYQPALCGCRAGDHFSGCDQRDGP